MGAEMASSSKPDPLAVRELLDSAVDSAAPGAEQARLRQQEMSDFMYSQMPERTEVAPTNPAYYGR